MRLGKTEIRLRVLLNYIILCSLSIYLIITTSLNLATTLYPMVHHIPTQLADNTTGCNGHPEYCSRTYDNITQIGTHDSAFYGVMPSNDQNVDVTTQLNAGVRFLQAQTHRTAITKQLSMCHTSCAEDDAGPLEGYLITVKKWLDKHPNEVLTLLLTNGDYLDVGAFDEVFIRSGILKHAYIPPSAATPSPPSRRRRDTPPSSSPPAAAPPVTTPPDPHVWPTLQQMITSSHRLVIFLDYGASPATIPYILDEFTHFWETPFDVTTPFFPSCSIDRPSTTAAQLTEVEQRMYIVNHYLDTEFLGVVVPDRRDAGRTNAWDGEGGVGAHVQRCESQHGGKTPRVVLVDYFDVGSWREAEGRLNGVRW